jgi:hypothetical protein
MSASRASSSVLELGEGIEERLGRLLEGHAVLVPVAADLAFVPNKGDSV